MVLRDQCQRIPTSATAALRSLLPVLVATVAAFASQSEAAQCTASFPDGAQTISNTGNITFLQSAQLFNSWDNVLDTWTITDNNTISNTCFAVNCSEANTGALALAPGAFLVSSGATDVTVPNNGSAALTLSQYDDVIVGTGALLTTTASITEYRMDDLTVNANAIVRLTAGNYWIDTMSMAIGSRIEVTGTGTVRLFVNDAVSGWGDNIVLNAAPAAGSQFFLYGYSSLTFGNSMQLYGLVYGASTVTSGANSVITGAITAATTITLGTSTQLTYSETTIVDADLGTLCRKASNGPWLEWRFEQNSWSGIAGEVLDETANNQDGTAVNGAQTQNTTPAIIPNPGTCRYGDFVTASSQSIQIGHNTIQNIDNSMTVTAWIRPRSYNAGGLRSFLSKDSNYEMHLNNAGRVNWWWQNQTLTSTADYFSNGTAPLNTWTHVAFRFRPGQQRIFINGAIDSATLSWNGSLALDTDPLQFGQDQGAAGRYWDGFIDEVRLYDRPLSDAEILAVKNATHPCPVVVDHYQFEHDGNGLTCAPETITLKACSNAACTTQYSGSYTVTLSPNGWVGGNTQTLTGSPQTLQLWHTTADTTTLAINSPSPTPTSALQCISTSGSGCNITFADSGFIFVAPDVTANKPSGLFNVSAVRKSDNATLCVPTFQSTTKNVLFYTGYLSPATGTMNAALRPASAGGFTTIATGAPGTAIPMAFNASGVAQMELHYADAGHVNLLASYSEINEGQTLLLTGADSFVARPAGFCVEAMQLASPTSPLTACNDSTCPAYQKAGEVFPLRVRAMAWETDSDGGAAYCTGNAVTPNFQGTLTTTVARATDPDLTSNGSLTPTSVSLTSAGDTTLNNQTVSEVGRFRISAGDNPGTTTDDYFGVALPITFSRAFGRIYPDHYNLGVGNYLAHCTIGSDFSYAGLLAGKTGESFPLGVVVTAVNKSGSQTQNYHGAYARLNGSAIAMADLDGVLPATAGNFTVAAHSMNFLSGQSLHDPAINPATAAIAASYTFNSARAPYVIGLQASVLDSDGSSGSSAVQGPIEFRLGRMVLENAYGPEQLPLPIPLRAEYFDGSRWRRNLADFCSAYAATSVTRDQFTGTLASPETAVESPASAQTVNAGVGQTLQPLRLAAPGLGEYGSLRVTLTVPSWLHFDWNGDGTPAESPSAIASYGRYRGSDRIIYWREQLPVIP